jgi:hypothetical protein
MTKSMKKQDGFLPFFIDQQAGKIWLEVAAPAADGTVTEVLYVHGLLQGLGSNPVGLDRGQLRDSKVIRIVRHGPKVLFEEINLRYRALSDDPRERRATRESFATSVIWAGKIAALDGDGRALVDLTSFLIRDGHGVVRTLRETDRGKYALDPARSAVDLSSCLAFPDNIEFEAILTWAADPDEEFGSYVRATVPDPQSITLVGHHSLIRLPDSGYRPRRLDPRIGMFGVEFLDYAAPLDQAIDRRWISRHRLEKVDPSSVVGPVKKPIVYYVDPGAPEPIRTALVEGASWWVEAFEAAGFVDAFRVELLPPGAHPLDVRYNMIQWVHRSTRGWSYGRGVVDPRTGEFIKGHVSLGSLRVRQDRRIFEGLAGTSKTGTGDSDDPIELALARIRQLAAHEVGHTLGLAHNFAASTYDGRASVMDYPAPRVGITAEGALDFTQAYGVGIGSWDKQCIKYAYSEFAPERSEDAALEDIIADTLANHVFVADQDARPFASSDPRGNLWDNGADAVEELVHTMRVRRIALDRFGEGNLLAGRPLAELEEVLVPIYFYHRYQLEAAVKTVGGMEYDYAVRGDGQSPTRMIGGDRQRQALEAALKVLEPAALDLPESVLRLMTPRPFSWRRNREMFATATWPAFDALGAASTAADHLAGLLLDPARLARLEDFHRRDRSLPGVGEVLNALIGKVFPDEVPEDPRLSTVRRSVQRAVTDRMVEVASRSQLRPSVRADLEWTLRGLVERLSSTESAQETALVADLQRFLGRDSASQSQILTPAAPPPGSPIGMVERLGCGTTSY